MQEDSSQRPNEKDGDGPVHVQCQELEFSYASRPKAKVLQGIDVDVSSPSNNKRPYVSSNHIQ